MTRRGACGLLAAALAVALAAGCGRVTAWRLAGEWESEALPRRTLILRGDGSYLQRFSGKTLGFVSEVLGPETGRWQVESHALVLTPEADGSETTRRLPIDGLGRESVSLAGERWSRVR
jgi:hypothetical protein